MNETLARHDQTFGADDGPPRATSPFGHRLLFFTFVTLAFVLFSPLVVLPLTREYCELLAEETRQAQRQAELQREIQRHDELLDAFARDITVNERLAILELHYRNPHEELLPVPRELAIVPPPQVRTPAYQSDLLIPDDWPEDVRTVERWAEERGLIDLLLDQSLRPMLLLMAGGLVVAAFVLFAPRVPPRGAVLMPAAGKSTPRADASAVRAAV